MGLKSLRINFLKLIFRPFLGLSLVILALAATKTFFDFFSSLSVFDVNIFQFFYGVLFYLFFHLFIFKPDYLYILGHELAHSLAGLLCGARITEFRVSKSGGHVRLTKNNLFIELAPYFIPVYSLLWFLMYFLAKHFLDIGSEYHRIYIFGIGFSISFHIIMTRDALKINQPDLRSFGTVFSWLFIYTFNLFIVILIICFVIDKEVLSGFFAPFYKNIRLIIGQTFDQLFI